MLAFWGSDEDDSYDMITFEPTEASPKVAGVALADILDLREVCILDANVAIFPGQTGYIKLIVVSKNRQIISQEFTRVH